MNSHEKKAPEITVDLAKKLLEDQTVYLTEEGKQILKDMIK
ncbi:hypothetical protein GCM10011351_30740 [Paraliobacillus quinghaiensis]|uniref:Uncharacterized protein n=1 Tax=Paraliobacillus quinghaiensis TaxID=470815 RepID=A0A917WZD6_9BACI|nr:hypothetical protein [Paraliobacillus quinghaiensis]GGM42644.1 hypothetical protein GCM10011351_30740 [Paraliobacillus quinghaiensis]